MEKTSITLPPSLKTKQLRLKYKERYLKKIKEGFGHRGNKDRDKRYVVSGSAL